MNTVLNLLDRKLYLERYPVKHQHKSLQAWDAADEYAMKHLDELISNDEITELVGQTLVLNDDFGALSIWLHEYKPYSLSDSWVSHKIAKVNLKHNELSIDDVSFVTSTDELNTLISKPLKLVLIKLPRSMAYLQHQLIQLQQVIDSDTTIIACGKVKSVTSSVIKLFEKHLGPVKTSLAQKKARLMFCQYQGLKETLPDPTLIEDSAVSFKLLNLANVFSREQVDVGARLLLKQLPECNQQQVIDLGCGNGILGIQTLLNNPEAHLTFVDESYMAVESARQNLMNAQGHTDNASFVVSNCLDEVLMKQRNFADHILCNPPFHQQNVITDHIAYQMFTDSKKALKPGGQVRIVANRHLDYPHKLNKLFDGHEVLASNSKFSVMACIN